MASPERRLRSNAPGDVYVDDSCIDCGTCRWMAPAVFGARGGQSRVHTQPASPRAERAALRALLACPTASIGVTRDDHPLREVAREFPLPLDGEPDVFHCGFHAEASFGATSYLIRRPGGNVLVDSPRYSAALARRIEALGGVRWMFLTHRDDVADHEKFQQRFGCARLLHAGDARGSLRGVERLLTGEAPIPLASDLLILPTPGHTRGSACLLYRERFLFSGDTVAWDPQRERLKAFRGACWYDWSVLRRSLEGMLRGRPFSWVLPGHGWPAQRPEAEMAAALEACIAAM